MKIKVIGAGSIGNHIAHASRLKGWEVVLCDNDRAALERSKAEIYPARYGEWDQVIKTCLVAEAPRGGFDIIFIGTPPDTHIPVALEVMHELPRALVIEKPLAGTNCEGLDQIMSFCEAKGISAFVGYTHAVGDVVMHATDSLRENSDFGCKTLDVEFREHWGGIFKAHPWLSGPSDSYLGYSSRGGGSLGEHSHALNLWQYFSRILGKGRVVGVDCSLDMVRDESGCEYDQLSIITLITETGFMGRCVQDVVTHPSRKSIDIQGNDSAISIQINGDPRGDVYTEYAADGATSRRVFEKSRPDDFYTELSHINDCLTGAITDSPLALSRGLETMTLILAAHKAFEEKRRVKIEYRDSALGSII